MKKTLFAGLLCAALNTPAHANPLSPYAGQENREIKALSAEEVENYLAGKGMGFAKTAELNGYPGPSHVLSLANELELTTDQKQHTQALFHAMEEKAIALGRTLVQEEQALDKAFAEKIITPAMLEQALQRIAALQAQIRHTHLHAHLAQVQVLTSEQITRYAALRGYTAGGKTNQHGSHRH